jgi:hypothetical protein
LAAIAMEDYINKASFSIKLLVLVSFLFRETESLGQDLQLAKLTKSDEFKTIEKRTRKKTYKFYRSIYSELSKDEKLIVVPSINITFNKEGSEPQYSFSFGDSKVAPFVIVTRPNSNHISMVDIADGAMYSIPYSSLVTEDSLSTDKLSIMFHKYGQILDQFLTSKSQNAFVVSNVDSCWIMMSGEEIRVFDIKRFQLHDTNWILTQVRPTN